MQSAENISHLLGNLYCAAADPEQWPMFIESISHAIGATSGFVVALGDDFDPSLYSDFGFDSDFQRAYQNLFRSHDITLDRFLEAGEKGRWIGIRQSLIPDHELDRSLFFNDFMRTRNIYHQAGFNLGRTDAYPHAGISLLRPRSKGEFGEETVQLLTLLAPHFAQGFLVHQRIHALSNTNQALAQSLDSNGVALIAVDGKGRILTETAAARLLIEKRDVLRVKDGRLHIEWQEQDRKLQNLISGAARVGAGLSDPVNCSSPGGAMLAVRQVPLSPLQIVVTPFHSDLMFLGTVPSAIVFFTDPDAKSRSRKDILRQLYQLSPSEASFVDWLVQGLDVKQAAERMRITENSARSLLKCVFRKTGLNSQSGLMRMVLNLPGIG